jgi:hypothetical protein
VATFLSSTVTFGTAKSVGSVTVPCKVAPVVWAKAQPHATATIVKSCGILQQFITCPPEVRVYFIESSGHFTPKCPSLMHFF